MEDQGKLNKILESIRVAQQANIAKSFTQSGSAISGITEYDLEAGARLLYPITTILRNMIPRVVGGAGTQANWRGITAVNPGQVSPGVAEGNRGGAISQTVTDNLAKFAFFGLENFLTFEADYAAAGFDNLRSLAVTELLQSTMEAEEKVIIGGNSSLALGTTPTPTGTPSTTGGTLAAQTDWTMYAVALTYDGYRASTTAALAVPFTRTNTDGTTTAISGFSAATSAAAGAVTTTGATSSIAYTVAPVNGAIGYAWFFGRAGTERFAAITTTSKITITAAPTTTQLYSAVSAAIASDVSTNSLVFDGLLTQIMKSGSGSYVKDLAGAVLTSTGSGTGGIQEIDDAIQAFYDNFRLVPDTMIVSGQDQKNMKNKILNGNTNSAPFFLGAGAAGGVMGGTQFKKYNNPIGFGAQELNVITHPFLPQGTIIFYSTKIPYQLSNVSNIMQMKLRRDYYQIEWPLRSRKYEYGVYFDGVLQNYFLPAFGVLKNVGNG